MKNERKLKALQDKLREHAPIMTLEAFSRVDMKWTVTYRSLKRQIGERPPEVWYASISSSSGSSGGNWDLPDSVMKHFLAQYPAAVERMDGFYQKALSHMTGKLVLQALDGERVSWKQVFQDEMTKTLNALGEMVTKAGEGVNAASSHEHATYQHRLVFNGEGLGNVYLSNTNMHTDMTHEENYLVLPDIVKAVQRWCRAAPLLTGG